MDIKLLQAKNFLALKDIDIAFDQFNFIIGDNNVGKSSIRDAIEWTMTGDTRMIKGSKIAEKYLVSDDPNVKEANTHLKVDGIKIDRRRGKKQISELSVQYQGQQVPQGPKANSKTEKEDKIIELLGTSEEIVHYVLDGEEYIGLKPSDRREILFNEFGDATAAKLENMIESSELSENEADSVITVLNDLGDIDALIDHYTELRRDAKRDRRRLNNKIEDCSTQDTITIELEDNVKKLPYEKALHKLDNDINPAIDQLKDELDNLPVDGGSQDSREEVESYIKKLKQKRDKIGSPEALSDKLSDLKAQKAIKENKLTLAEEGEGKCIYDGECDCPVDESAIEEFAEVTRNSIEELEGKIKSVKEKSKKAKKIQKKINKASAKLDMLPSEDEIQRYEQVKSEYDKFVTMKNAINEVKQEGEKYKELEKKLQSAEQRIKRSNKVINELEDIKESLISNSLSAYRSYLDTISNIMNEKYEITDNLELMLEGRPVYCLSTSEKLRVAYANQIALAVVTDLGFVALDEVDTLFGDNRINLLKVLKGFKGLLDTAIVILSSDVDQAPLAGAKLIEIDDGRVVNQN